MDGSGALGFVPDGLMDDPPRGPERPCAPPTRSLLPLDFELLLLAHGEPIVGGGKQALREFIDGAR